MINCPICKGILINKDSLTIVEHDIEVKCESCGTIFVVRDIQPKEVNKELNKL